MKLTLGQTECELSEATVEAMRRDLRGQRDEAVEGLSTRGKSAKPASVTDLYQQKKCLEDALQAVNLLIELDS